MKQIQIALHHTSISRTSNPVQLYAVNRYHRNKWNFKSSLGWYVGYNFFIDGDGTLTQTRSLDEETIANRGHNCDVPEKCDTISICLAGDFDVEYPTSNQNDTLRDFLREYDSLAVTFHRDIQINRTCPGRNLNHKYIENIWKPITEDKLKAVELQSFQSQLDRIRKLVEALLRKFKNRR